MSVTRACTYKNEEIPTWDLQAAAKAVKDEWNRDVFSKIQVATDGSANQTRLALLYSSLYFMHLIPSQRIGENPLWESVEPYWDDFYTMCKCSDEGLAMIAAITLPGDLFRNQVSLWHLIQPSYYESMIRSLIDMWKLVHAAPLPA
jgi:putative alpha-1,2-mannosidase